MVSESGWWVFKRPLLSDRLFVIGLLLGFIALVAEIPRLDDMGWGAAVLSVLLVIPSALLLVGIVGGSVRQYRRGRSVSA